MLLVLSGLSFRVKILGATERCSIFPVYPSHAEVHGICKLSSNIFQETEFSLVSKFWIASWTNLVFLLYLKKTPRAPTPGINVCSFCIINASGVAKHFLIALVLLRSTKKDCEWSSGISCARAPLKSEVEMDAYNANQELGG